MLCVFVCTLYMCYVVHAFVGRGTYVYIRIHVCVLQGVSGVRVACGSLKWLCPCLVGPFTCMA